MHGTIEVKTPLTFVDRSLRGPLRGLRAFKVYNKSFEGAMQNMITFLKSHSTMLYPCGDAGVAKRARLRHFTGMMSIGSVSAVI